MPVGLALALHGQAAGSPVAVSPRLDLDQQTCHNAAEVAAALDDLRDLFPHLLSAGASTSADGSVDRAVAAFVRRHGSDAWFTSAVEEILASVSADMTLLCDQYPEDISAETLPRDFARNPRIHRCWQIRHRP